MNFQLPSRSPTAPSTEAQVPFQPRTDPRSWPLRTLAATAAFAVTAGLFALTLAALDDAHDDVADGFALGDHPSIPAGFLSARAEDCRGGGATAAPAFVGPVSYVVSVPRTARKEGRQ